ncbi:BCCT family transporter, partial [Arthrobacter sp. 179]|uniref:BCCT family transporter n=1 Tax=Arthrobacter sp. 179 TaxID=3457734 RepID=UPI004034933D
MSELPSTTAHPTERASVLDRKVAGISIAVIAVFVASSMILPGRTADLINSGFSGSAKWFGAYWQYLLLATFVVAIVLAFTPYAKARLSTGKPEFTRFKWVSMIMCTLLAGGGVFWAAAEPIAHYIA